MMPVRRQKNINCCQIRRLPTVQDGIKSAHWLWLIGFHRSFDGKKSTGRTKRHPWTKQDYGS